MGVSHHKTCKKLEERESINMFSNMFFVKPRIYAASFVDVVELDMSLSKSEISISVPADSMKKYNVNEFLSPKFSTRVAEIIWAFFIPFFNTNSMSV